MSAWILVGLGVAIWLLSQRVPPPKNPASPRLGWFIGLVGIAVLVLGVYAGVKGPIRIGSAAFKSFSFVTSAHETSAEALIYARNNLQINALPSAGWRGSSKTELTCDVRNNGSRRLTYVKFTFMTKDRNSIEIKARGPYPPKAKKTVIIALPDNVSRSYFSNGISASQISGASF